MKRYHPSLFVAFTICILVLASCATFNKVVTNEALVSELATRAAISRVLYEHPDWQAKVIDMTNLAIGAIDSKTLVSVNAVVTYVEGQINWAGLLPEEQVLVKTVIGRIQTNLADNFAATGVEKPEQQLVAVRQVLVWANDQAKLPVSKK